MRVQAAPILGVVTLVRGSGTSASSIPTATNGEATAVDIRAGKLVFEPLPAGSVPVPMTLLEFAQRAFERNGASFDGASVRLTGFVAGPDGEGFRLACYQIACCASDAAPVVVRVMGVHGGLPARDQWVSVTGRLSPLTAPLPCSPPRR